jgi:glucose-1-phosphate cytidylyltransferase
MKVVLFCGGQGMRLRGGNSDPIPKPLVEVGSRPVLWHLMKYYAHHGHKEFILCLGYGGTAIKNYFVNYDERILNDFVYTDGGKNIELLATDIHDWRITFVDTGNSSSIGERLRRVRGHIGQDEVFLANYADGLSDLDLTSYVADFLKTGKIASFVSVPAPHTFHIVHADADNYVQKLEHVSNSLVRINGGFFVLRRQIFDYLEKDEELVIEAFARLIPKRQLLAVPYDGFWRNMDTFKDKMQLDEMVAQGPGPWEAWRVAKG